MCGIAGIFDPDHQINQSKNLVAKMCDQILHRGPDAQGLQDLPPVVFGHRRLSIIDTHAAANQPMQDASGRYLLTYNGEIYNFREIRQELEGRGISFRTSSDTEVLVEAWAAWGLLCLQKLVGMFAFAIWDQKEQELFLVRDRLGEKPLFYGYIDPLNPAKGLLFSSGLKALMAGEILDREISSKAVQNFLSLNYTLTNQSIFKNVHKLPAAHFMRVKSGQKPKVDCYWNLADSFYNKRLGITENEAKEELNHLLSQALKGQMISDVPLGAFLSGGIDSSTIVAGMTRGNSSKKPQTFSIGFEEKSYSELAESKLVADYLSVEHHTKVISADLAKSLPEIVGKTDEPFADTSIIPTYYLAQYTRDLVTVSLSGDGGDELFLGYETHMADKMHQALSWVPRSLFKAGYGVVNTLWLTSFNKVSFDYKLKQFLYGSQYNFARAHYAWREICKPQELKQLLEQDRDQVDEWSGAHQFARYFDEVKGCHPLDQASYVDLKTWLVDDILVKVDRAAMAHSLEVRAPFLDHRIVEFAASLPVDLKLQGKEKKYLLKKSQEDYLPGSTLYRAKQGFNAPVSLWLNGQTKQLAKEAMYSKAMQPWVRPDVLDQWWLEHENHKVDRGLQLFGLTCLGLWLEDWKK